MKSSIAQILAKQSRPGCAVDCGSAADAQFVKAKLQANSGDPRYDDLRVVGTRLCSATLSSQEVGKAVAACLE